MLGEQERLTYAELNAKANRLAHRLCGLGVGPEALVGIYMERSLELVVAILAVLKAGGAYVPLDPDYPTQRLEFMLRDAQVAALLTQEGLRGNLPPHDAPVICLDAEAGEFGGESEENPASGVHVDNLAYGFRIPLFTPPLGGG